MSDPEFITSKFATQAEVDELRERVLSLSKLTLELEQAVNRLQSQPLARAISQAFADISPRSRNRYRTSAQASAQASITETANIEDLTDSQAYKDFEQSLRSLARMILGLEAEIEDKLFAIWQGIAIRQVEENFWGHRVPLDLIHEMGFTSMSMPEFLNFLGNLNDPTLEFVASSKQKNYKIGEFWAWYITFRS